MVFAVASHCSRAEGRKEAHRTDIAVFEAMNADEAEGRALRAKREEYPESEGWTGHFVNALQVKPKWRDKL